MSAEARAIGALSSEELAKHLGGSAPSVALVPVGSVEPHGPHLPLATDTLISHAAAERAAVRLSESGVVALVAPAVAYGVTDFASGFAGAISIPAPALTAFVRAIVDGYLAAGMMHVCLVNNHLEPAHDVAVRDAIAHLPDGHASVACPLTRRWGRTLGDEFRSGACHAGRYETSLMLAAAPELVLAETARDLPDVAVSLSDGIKAGKRSFRAMGIDRAYTGAPRAATADEGRELLDKLATMIATEVTEGLARRGPARPKRGRMNYTKKEELPERYYQTLVQMMQSQAYRELAAAQMFGYGLQFVPELRWLKFMTWHIREEMEHYEDVVKMYAEVTGDSVEPFVHDRLKQKPIDFAASWYELAMAQFLYDRGGFWQLREYENCTFSPYQKVITKIIKEEKGHQALGEKIVVELTRRGKFDDLKQPVFEKWLRQGLLSFGRPETDGARYAIEVGLKKRDPGVVMQDFIDDIKPAVKACGLLFPPMEKIGIVPPPGGLDVSLASTDETKAEGYA
jgi:creatinine amidohydrolase